MTKFKAKNFYQLYKFAINREMYTDAGSEKEF